jgi:hypothetical protein
MGSSLIYAPPRRNQSKIPDVQSWHLENGWESEELYGSDSEPDEVIEPFIQAEPLDFYPPKGNNTIPVLPAEAYNYILQLKSGGNNLVQRMDRGRRKLLPRRTVGTYPSNVRVSPEMDACPYCPG